MENCLSDERDWLAQARLRFGAIQDLSRRLAAVADAREKIEAVMQREGWDPDIEAVALLERLRALEMSTDERLQVLLASTPPREDSVEARLEKLAALAGLTGTQGDEETSLYEGVVAMPVRMPPAASFTLLASMIIARVGLQMQWSSVLLLVILVAGVVASIWLSQKNGTFSLRFDRLLWKPPEGPAVELSMQELARDPGHWLHALFGARISTATRRMLENLILLYGRGPLRGVNRPPEPDSLQVEAVSTVDGARVPGALLLSHRRVAFVPNAQASALTEALTGVRATDPLLTAQVLGLLQRLTPDALNQTLQKLKGVPGAVVSTEEVTGELLSSPGRAVQLKLNGAVVDAELTEGEYQRLETMAPWLTPRRN